MKYNINSQIYIDYALLLLSFLLINLEDNPFKVNLTGIMLKEVRKRANIKN